VKHPLLLKRNALFTLSALRVIDGDTIVLVNGEKIRYLGIDTPETRFSPRGPQYYADEATAANRRLVEGKNVRLEFDVERRDIYGRLLAYVFVDTIFVNAELVRGGYAKTLFFRPNNRYRALLSKLERESREAGLGMWAAKR
jgi:micrococcal nuclease